MHQTRSRERGAIWLAVLLPVVIMSIYFFGFRHVYPFGNASLLTVDMGQQYIDFYAYFRDTVTTGNFGQLLYGWNKALGGDMTGTWAYYLLSPFNFLLLLFPKTQLDLAVTVMTLTKYAAAGGAMAVYLRGRKVHGGLLPAFSTAYALSGWFIANQLNLMWFDSVICLPLVALGIDRLGTRRWRSFAIWLTVAIITNYYIGFMVCLFSCCYFLYGILRDWPTRPERLRRLWRFTRAGVLAAGSSAVVLLPTVYQILRSKGTYTVNQIHARIEYNPLDLLSKLFSGAFNFDQMPEGFPNIFVGALATLGVLIFLANRRLPRRERLGGLLVLTFLILSAMFEPLDLLWHGMQFPVWYPYRFSFVLSFFFIVLAVRGVQSLPTGIALWPMLALTAITVGTTAYVWVHLDRFNFLSTTSLTLSAIYALLVIMILSAASPQRRAAGWLLALIAVIDLSTNAALALNQISYVSHSDYHTYTETLRAGVDAVKKRDDGTYRIGKTILRTKNDAMQIGYMGQDQFNSMFEPSIPQFYAALGQPEGDGFVTYANGTLVTDALLDTKYWISARPVSRKTLGNTLLPALSTRPDLSEYTRIAQTRLLNVSRNHRALGIGFAANQDILNTHLTAATPLANQARLLSGLTGHDDNRLFTPLPLTLTRVTNVKQPVNGVTYSPKRKNQDAILTYTFSAPTSHPVYLTVPASFTDNAVRVAVNGQHVVTYDTFRNPVVLNVTPSQSGVTQTLTLRFKKPLDLNLLHLDMLAKDKLTAALATLKQSPLTHVKQGGHTLSGHIRTTADRPVVFLSIPNDPGWQVKIDGRLVKTKTVAGLLMGIKTRPGHHVVTMTYWPPYFKIGLVISIISVLLLRISTRVSYRHHPVGRHAYRPRQK